MEFPVYRKYANNKSYFKITSETRFDELKVTGKLIERYPFEAKIYPDRVFIQDMLAMENDHWIESSEKEFEELEKCLPS